MSKSASNGLNRLQKILVGVLVVLIILFAATSPSVAALFSAIKREAINFTINRTQQKEPKESVMSTHDASDNTAPAFTDLIPRLMDAYVETDSRGDTGAGVTGGTGSPGSPGEGGTLEPIKDVPPDFLAKLTESVTVGPYTYYKLPTAPNGEYSQDGACPASQYGRAELLYVISQVAAAYKAYADDPARGNIAGSRLWMGDLNASGHKSHSFGVDVDIYVTDGAATVSQYGSGSSPKYDPRHAIELGKMFMKTNMMQFIFYDDDSVIPAVNAFRADPANNIQNGEMQGDGVHFNHMHIRLNVQSPAAGSCSDGCSKPTCAGDFTSCNYIGHSC